ncbi:MAG: DUF4384 domain-containing protein [Candidatus Kuenenia sp.]|nr:DUF4384 domain-containing protein [Candidatus Kuenenia hertensis]
MNKPFPMLFIIPFILLIGCTTEKYVVKQPTSRHFPDWINKVPEEDENYLYFIGRKTRALSRETGEDDAFQNAVGKIAKMIQSKISIDYEKLRHEEGIAYSPGISDAESYIREKVRLLSSEIAHGVKEIDTFAEENVENNRVLYNVNLLVRYPVEEYKRIKNTILGIDPESETGLTFLKENNCREAINRFNTLAIKKPEDVKILYYLALSYDRCGELQNALSKYSTLLRILQETHLGISEEAQGIQYRAKERVEQITDKLAKDLIVKAEKHAASGLYDAAMEALEDAYKQTPSQILMDKIMNLHSGYAMESIADEIVTKCDLLTRKNIAVSPFVDLGKNDSSQIGMDIVSCLMEKIMEKGHEKGIILQERQLLSSVLKEIALRETLSVDAENSLGELAGNGIEALIVGAFGYRESEQTYKIHVRMLSTGMRNDTIPGMVIAAKSVRKLSPVWLLLGMGAADNNTNRSKAIDIWTEKKEYRIGESARVFFRIKKDCYVYIYDIMSNHRYLQLFPNAYEMDNFVRAGKEYSVPSPRASIEYALKTNEPAGIDYLLAIAVDKEITPADISSIIHEKFPRTITMQSAIHENKHEMYRSVDEMEMQGLFEILRTRGSRGLEPTPNASSHYYHETSGTNNKLHYDINMYPFKIKK